jgi:hypothetical protein
MLVVLLLPSAAWSAHSPAPVPSEGTAGAAGWDCDRELDGLGNETGSHCVVTQWSPANPPVTVEVGPVEAVVPTPLPVVEQNPQTAGGCGSADDPCVTAWTPELLGAVAVPALALVLVGGIRVAQGLRR